MSQCHSDWSDIVCCQCAVMRACMAQLPTRTLTLTWKWLISHGYKDRGTWAGYGTPAVQLIADRLGDWVRWEGIHSGYECLTCGVFRPGVMRGAADNRCACWRYPDNMAGSMSICVHPLDATPAGGLRPATKYPPNSGSEILGGVVDWAALAVITEVMEPYGLWSALHVWRPPADTRNRHYEAWIVGAESPVLLGATASRLAGAAGYDWPE